MTTKISNRRRASKTVAPASAATVDVTPNAAPALPARSTYGNGARSIVPALVPTLAAITPLLGRDPRAATDRAAFYDVTFPNLTPADVPALLMFAANLLASVVSVPVALAPLPCDATDPVVSYYYGSRGRHPANQNVSDTDRRDAAAAIGEMILRNVDRVTHNPTRRAFNGRYGTRDGSLARCESVASHVVAALTPAAPESSDAIVL